MQPFLFMVFWNTMERYVYVFEYGILYLNFRFIRRNTVPFDLLWASVSKTLKGYIIIYVFF